MYDRQQQQTKTMSEQRCKYCNYEWNYTGKYIVMTTCPDCQRRTPIYRTQEEIEIIKQLKELEKKEIEAEQESPAEKGVKVMVDNNKDE